jgi:ATP-dependent DNA ligase
MLAALIDWDKIIATFKGQPFGIEIKFDGERIQIHKKGNEFRFFTR